MGWGGGGGGERESLTEYYIDSNVFLVDRLECILPVNHSNTAMG